MIDPMTAALAAQNAERDRLRADVARFERTLADAHTELEGVKADRDRLAKLGDAMFVEGYDQAVREIRDHFKKTDNGYVAAVIEEIWLKETA